MSVNGGLSFDPATMGTGEYQYAYPVLAAWLERDDEGSYTPWLAQKVDTPDASTIVVTMRPNLEFSNGEKLDATAAVNSINRTVAAKAPGLRIAEMALVASVTVDSPTQFTIKLNQPQVGLFYPLMADAETAPVAPASIAQNDRTSKTAIGAGPMKIDSYTPGVGVKMSKNDKYFEAKSVKLGGAEIVNVAAAPGNAVTALRSNTVDLVTPLTFSDRASLTAPIKLETRSMNAPYWVNMCMKDGTPLGDVKIRQALNYATDREDINEKVYDGEGRVAWSLFPGDDPVFGNPATDNAYPYNPKKAKKLLAEAGYADGLELTMITMPAGDTATIDQVVQAQWAKVGVNVDLKVTSNVAADWYTNPTGQLNTVPMIREGVSRLHVSRHEHRVRQRLQVPGAEHRPGRPAARRSARRRPRGEEDLEAGERRLHQDDRGRCPDRVRAPDDRVQLRHGRRARLPHGRNPPVAARLHQGVHQEERLIR